jgi:hypothetical protein
VERRTVIVSEFVSLRRKVYSRLSCLSERGQSSIAPCYGLFHAFHLAFTCFYDIVYTSSPSADNRKLQFLNGCTDFLDVFLPLGLSAYHELFRMPVINTLVILSATTVTWGSSCSTHGVTLSYGLDSRCSIPGKDKRYSCLIHSVPTRSTGSHSLISNGY